MIYCVEDDYDVQNLILYTLRSSGFEVKGFTEGSELFKELANNKPDLIMLDIMLPNEDGLSILKKIRSNDSTKDIPVILATAKGSEYDKVFGLEAGADDYLVKPFGMMEMVARVKALLRRVGNKTKDSIKNNGPITMDEDRHMVLVDDKVVKLTLKEYDLLRLFLNNIEHVFTRDSLLSLIWGMDFIGESRTVDVHVGTLRTKLEKAGSLIETVRGVGYKMVKNYEEENI